MSTTIKPKRVVESRTLMTELVMPNDTNPLGNLMGGYLMKWMDIACSICAAKHCEAHVVTASVDHVAFDQPIHLGDVITLEAQVTRAFNTSVEVYVEVFSSTMAGENHRKSNHAYFTFVALDDETKRPKKAPEVIALTAEEKKRFDSAPRRREVRLILGGRMKAEDATNLKAYFSDMH